MIGDVSFNTNNTLANNQEYGIVVAFAFLNTVISWYNEMLDLGIADGMSIFL